MNKVNWGYCTHSWNPLAMRCTPVSAGCDNCWHLRMCDRLARNPKLSSEVQAAYAGEGPPVLRDKHWGAPLTRKAPAIIAVQFMGDLFHDNARYEDILGVWQVMFMARHHVFLVLTKRPERMRTFVNALADHPGPHYQSLPNIYLGATCENQATADERIPVLLQIPAAGHWVSMEPMLEAVNLEGVGLHGCLRRKWSENGAIASVSGVVLGGESGPGARPMHPDWARGVRDQCEAAGVPFHFKQWGAWGPHLHHSEEYDSILFDNEVKMGSYIMKRVGAKRAGRLLDGRTYDETAWGRGE